MSLTNLSPPANILSVFENTIRLSADILIASADILIASARTLIVFVSSTNKVATKRKYTPLPSLFFLLSRRHVVTL